MKLCEIISFDPVSSKRDDKANRDIIRTKTDSKQLGSRGSFATAYSIDSGKRLNQVTKVGRTGSIGQTKSNAKEVEEDGYLLYLKSTYQSNNPYYPKVYNLRITRNPEGYLDYIADIERLYDFDSEKIAGNDDLMESLYDSMFYGRQYGYFDSRMPLRSIISSIERGFYMPEIIKDAKLAEALGLISELSKKYYHRLDLHRGNVMWRITGNRPHFVISDPLA